MSMNLNLNLVGKVRRKSEMHRNLHYKSPRPDKHERSTRKICSLLLSVALVEKSKSGNNTSLALSNFIRYKTVTFKVTP